jgi:polyisoprenoid-binding protein YceI
MKRTFISSMVAVTALITVAGCSDPSDNVPKSGASAPKDAPSPAPGGGTEYVIRVGSKIGFVGSKVTGSHNGGFTNFAGSFKVQDGKITGSPEIKINMKSTWADASKLTGHLKSPDFFDVEKFPTSTFTVTTIAPEGSASKVTGNLQLHGVTKSISFPATVAVAADALTVKAEFAINRKDFGIVYAGKSDDLIRDNVVIRLDLKATPGAARPEDLVAN